MSSRRRRLTNRPAEDVFEGAVLMAVAAWLVGVVFCVAIYSGLVYVGMKLVEAL